MNTPIPAPTEQLRWTDAVHFYPYVGDRYKQGLVDGIKVLLLGESHYGQPGDDDRERDLTLDNFSGYAEEDCPIYASNSFWGRLQRIVTRSPHPSQAESAAAWRRVAYGNFVQEVVGTGARQRPNKSMWATGQPALTELVRRLSPHVVLVLGSATWDHITEGRAAAEAAIQAQRSSRSIWLIPSGDGEARSTWVYHPSTNYDSTQNAIGVFEELLDRARVAI